MLPNVMEVEPLPGHRLRLLFNTGEVRVCDAEPYLGVGRYSLLCDEVTFRQVGMAFGTVEWPGGLDFDPEDLYRLSIPVISNPHPL